MRSIVVACAATLAVGAACSRPRVPGVNSPAYEDTTRNFYRALAELQVGLLDDAKRDFGKATALAPGEPAAWADLGIAFLRLGQFEEAKAPIDKAVSLDPNSSELVFLRGRLLTSQGKLDEGIADYKRAVELDPANLRVRYALSEELERAGGDTADAEAEQQFETILRARPGNVAVILERARLAAKHNDTAVLRTSVRSLEPFVARWPAGAVEQFRALQTAVENGNVQDAQRSVAFLRNLLVRDVTFRESLTAVRTPTELIAEPFDTFLKMPSPSSKPSAPDRLQFTPQPIGVHARLALATVLGDSGREEIISAGDSGLELHQPEAPGRWRTRSVGGVVGINAIVPLDWSRDFRMDFAVAGDKGVRMFTQTSDGNFKDATPKTDGVIADTVGLWAADIEMDGDLDLIAGVRAGPPIVLRNNGDGSWKQMRPFTGISGARQFAWGDLDGDGDPDAAFLDDSGNVHVFENRQSGAFREMSAPGGLGATVAFGIGDANGDGHLDLVTLESAGTLRRSTWTGNTWTTTVLATWPDHIDVSAVGTYRVFLEDIDNNGALDIVVSGPRTRVWLADAANQFTSSPDTIDAEIFDVADMVSDGRLELVGVQNGQIVDVVTKGTQAYHWQVLRPKAQPTAGDQRINSFGVGGEVEIRSGLLTQKQILNGQPVHFGLGTRTGVDVARIVWPNGIMQADFDLKADASIIAEQRLKGSCPWVFAYDGHDIRFVTDFLWRSPLGLRINAVDTAGVTQTEDWVKIRGDQLAAKDGAYDVRITAELWETHFIDHVALMVVDHPDDQDIFVDERFSRDAPSLAVHALTHPRPVRQAWDEAGRDVTEFIASRDGRYLATFDRGEYQGIAKDHFVEIDLGDGTTPRWLVANGWIYPTDSSINVAIAQQNLQPHGIALEAADAHGRWVVVAPDLGFPEGKNKTILIDLSAVARAGIQHPRRIRLRTNLEVYWDHIAIADDAPDAASMTTTRLPAASAELRFRGFSKTDYARRDVPEIPRYDIANVTQRWRDLIGYYTRFGDVKELLSTVDDRYVIMNAGDELRLSFAAAPPPTKGRSRDFVLIGDGWEKDGDYNTTASKTVEPLPQHGHSTYEAQSAGDIETDPVFKAHANDWLMYHTRFVEPGRFLSGLR